MQDLFGDLADSRWLRTFNENLVKVRETKGFVLQIQQGVLRDKSDMQVAEEMQSGWLQVPRMGYFAFAVTDVRGGTDRAEELMEKAIAAAKVQWSKGVRPDVEMITEIFEPLEGELRFNAWGGVEGPARVTFCDGHVYEGQFKRGLKHGPGTFTFATGNVDVLIFKEDRPNGAGVKLEKASGLFCLLKNGKKVQQISKEEARSSILIISCCFQAKEVVKEHGLPELPW